MITTHQRRKAQGLCLTCGRTPAWAGYSRCEACHEWRRDEAEVRRLRLKLAKEQQWRDQGLIPTPEALVMWGISLKALEGRVRRGTIKPVINNLYGGFNWYRNS